MPYGRGGAGNIQAATSVSESSKDLEASFRSAQQANINAPSASSHDQYAFSGRGGSGNYYSPSGLTQTGAFTSTSVAPPSLSTTSDSGKPHQLSNENTSATPAAKAPPPFAGRGGAGNYALSDERKLLEDELETGMNQDSSSGFSDQIARDVDEGLAKPPQAHLSESNEGHVDIWYGTNVGI